jgi:hypothetical protein
MTTSIDKPNLRPAAQLQKVEEARRDVEQRLASLRGRLESDVPALARTFTRNGTWAAIAVGFAAGLALALRTRRRA